MRLGGLGRLPRSDWPLLLVVAFFLLFYVAYTLAYVMLVPYPRLEITRGPNGWLVTDSLQPDFDVDDVIVQIGELSFEEYESNKLSMPFGEYKPEDTAKIILLDGEERFLKMPQPSLGDRIRRLLATLWFFPFWSAGTAVLLFLRPRDVSWRLLIAFMYLTALWATLGILANSGIGGSAFILAAIEWLMVPVFIHLHITVPSPLAIRWTRIALPVLYVLTCILALMEIFQVLDLDASRNALIIAISISFGLLMFRSLARRSSASDRNAARLMSAGIGLAFGPGIIVIAVPNIIGFSVPAALAFTISLIALPLLPILYTYAIYKRQLGKLEFRANRLISLYSFILIYPTIFLLLLLFGDQWITSPAGRTIYLLIVSMAFVLATPSLLKRFQGFLNRLAYGTHHDPDDILRVFAKQIPAALSSQEMVRLVTKEFMPSLLIRQSALWILENNKLRIVYAQRVPNDQVPENENDLRHLEERAGLYIPPNESIAYHLDWVRLAIPLVTREETIGIWLFGRRDPDDFYAKNDIDLLQALTNQLAPVMENIRLYEELQQHADNLADEVARRTSELRSEKDRTQAILDSAGEGIFFTDPVGVILYANPAMAMFSGYRAEELIGHTLDLWQTEEDSTDAYRQMWTAIYNGRDWSGELLLRRKDNSYVDVSLAVAPIQSHDGQLTGFVGVQSDISKLKEVDRLKSNIISSVSHELKTPLTTIKTYLMLLDRGRPEKRDGYITVLNRETERLTNIIVDLLDLSTLDTGKIPSRLEPISVQTVVEEVIASCVTRANAKEITMSSKVVGSIPRALADNNQMEQVLTNLLVNAINYTPLGGQVMVTAGSGELNGELAVWVRVTDTGSGIAPEDLPHLFDRFYRGRAAQESSSPGTGLGLSICKEIIDRHKGKLEVESPPGSGASFTVWLPAASSMVAESILPTISQRM